MLSKEDINLIVSQKRSSLQSSDTSDQTSESDHVHRGKEEEETSSQEMASVSMN